MSIPGIGRIPDPDKTVPETPYARKSLRDLQADLRRYQYHKLTPAMEAEVAKIQAELERRK